MRNRSLLLFLLGVPALAANASQTSLFPVAAPGTVRLENSFGEVSVEGWDRPDVQVIATRSGDRQDRVNSVKISASQEGNDVTVSTVYPPRSVFLHPLSRRSDVEIRYDIHAPRGSKLVIDHNSGGVNVAGIHGAIHATVVNGQITLDLAPGAYAIDAQCSLGKVYSDFEGQDRTRRLLGDRFSREAPAPAPDLYLRARIGDIVLVQRTGPAD